MEKKPRIKRKRTISIEKREFPDYLKFASHVLETIEKDLGEHIISSTFLGRMFNVRTHSGVYKYTVESVNAPSGKGGSKIQHMSCDKPLSPPTADLIGKIVDEVYETK